jgi:hypothetical protein
MQGPNIIRPEGSVFAISSTHLALNRTRSRSICRSQRIGRRLNGSKHINWRRASVRYARSGSRSPSRPLLHEHAGRHRRSDDRDIHHRRSTRWSWLARWSWLPRWSRLARQPPLGLPSPSLEQRTPLLLGLVDQAVLVKRLSGGLGRPAAFLLFRAVCLETPSQIPERQINGSATMNSRALRCNQDRGANSDGLQRQG